MRKKVEILAMIFVLSLACGVFAEEGNAGEEGPTDYSPYVRDYPQRVLFGYSHVHTALSNDAFGSGNSLGYTP